MTLRDLTSSQLSAAITAAKEKFTERNASWRGRVSESDYGNAFTDGFRYLLSLLSSYPQQPTEPPPNDPI